MEHDDSSPDDVNPSLPIDILEARRRFLAARMEDRSSGKYARVLLAALSGIPWIGSLLAAVATFYGESEQEQQSELHALWLQEHQAKLHDLGATLQYILNRFESFGEEFQQRIQSESYLALVRRAFRSWDQADTEQKREFIKRLLTNAGGMTLCPDDLVRLFIAWIDSYHESHFAVIAEIYKNPGSTRGQIWRSVHGAQVRENSAEADLFKLLIRDLSTGSVIRQHRATNAYGEFVPQQRAPTQKGRGAAPYKSAFDDQDQYELTELGGQFVRYTMGELVTRIGSTGSDPSL